MEGKQIKVEYLAGIVTILLAAGAAGLIVRPVRNPDVSHSAAIGDVVWNHELHARMKGLTCQACHHTTRTGVTNPPVCTSCHQRAQGPEALILAGAYRDLTRPEGAETPPPPPGTPSPAMSAFHHKCVGCHKAMAKGPVSCRDCHAQSFAGPHGLVEWNHREHSRQLGLECAFCHHTSKQGEEARIPPCGSCHPPAVATAEDLATGLKDHQTATHANCGFCHVERVPGAEVPSCLDCHPKMKPEAGAAPALVPAIHAKCLYCHNRKVKGKTPKTAMPSYCTDCHRPDPSFLPSAEAGSVLWSHARHGRDMSCETCHHDHADAPNEPYIACARCHNGQSPATPPLPDAAHGKCVTCHIEKKAGPTECSGCHNRNPELLAGIFQTETEAGTAVWNHRFHATALALPCQECHHNLRTREGLSYTVCQAAVSCPADAADPRSCAACHSSATAPAPAAGAPPPAAKPPAPGLYEIVHDEDKTCVGCHQKLGAGPVECNQCHWPK